MQYRNISKYDLHSTGTKYYDPIARRSIKAKEAAVLEADSENITQICFNNSLVMLGATNMKTFRFTSETEIINYEEQYLKKCREIIDIKYAEKIRAYGCEIHCSLCWTNDMRNKTYKKRPPFCHRYTCWFGYAIYKNRELICYDDIEGYTLGEASGFLYMKRERSTLFTKTYLEVTYIDDTSKLVEDLNNDLTILGRIF